MTPTKSITERFLQALGFEGLALLICTPLLVWITGRPALEMGVVTLGISLLALSWNVIFNSLFDRLKIRLQLANGGWTRVLHALLFEGGLILLAVPLIAALMKISLLEAFILDIGVLLFFLPYTYVYHWGYDVLREKIADKTPVTL
ncbi:multidrug/biocide efflux PACE transporter [Pseudomonas haemolytica]|uniref:Multidrug/biocide efflux PACE transporter n=1 Tax=Pseudomonas haemolytica TaxID=2600065 RepID=A0A5P1DHM6_9PSED|nr:multidrug/biocide efflux PACE transporter [Pseudomonas haemolytica]MBJ2247813.1 multidrug/biocide efflux PACE transporter [Pseudomonas haemolytica]MBJ2275443.1 multidrug/biocide efflux PACE transporter [Pseudomonas haemolytica]MBK3450518.1 multidrug/biocide efflux PACE transporter [Pseudomonas haemolytica]MBK3462229.1 multidrug/biocide efflux PACE transporter [Pseudomonas haemolytica]MRJ22228.1 multidrug/biocide efflux PACE transporter [Pseudomonas haemolytica]